MRYLAFFLFLVFLSFAFLQVNDPDPVWWITVYLVAAMVSWRAFRTVFNQELLMTLSAIYLAGAVNSWLQMTAWEGFFTESAGMQMKTVNQELAREAGGLIICLLACIVYLLASVRQAKRTKLPEIKK